jgi:catechol 2,3-dioxygenase-like lactoylglutathione lyase family enzyme
VNTEFIASVAVVAPEPTSSRRLYVDALGLPLQSQSGDEYVWSDKIDGAKHFGVWPLSQAAQACFGTSDWPAERTVPQVSIEFEQPDIAGVQAAADELEAKGYTLLHPVREEPWGQTIVRLLSPEGSIVGVCFTPGLRESH